MSDTLINQNQISAGEWVKPDDWIDIRSGALPNSIYFLVGTTKKLADCYHFDETGKLVSVDEEVYIESTGTQAIDTGKYISSNTIEIGTKIGFNFSNLNENDIIGNQKNGVSQGRFILGVYQGYIFGYSRDGSTCPNVTSNTLSGFNVVNIKANYDKQNSVKTLNVNGTNYSAEYTNTISNNLTTIKLFEDGVGEHLYSGRTYNLYLKENGVLSFNLVPVYAGLQIGNYTVPSNGMFDTVSQTFCGNTGSGSFNIGIDPKYPEFSFQPTISNSGTYDVFIDCAKQATTSSGTATTLNWANLGLETGYNVSYPENLETHIVRVTPTADTDTINSIHLVQNSSVEQGVLWIYFTITNSISLNNFARTSYGSSNQYICNLVESFESETGIIKVSSPSAYAFGFPNLKNIPTVDLQNGATGNLSDIFTTSGIKKINLINANNIILYSPFLYCRNLENVYADSAIDVHGDAFWEANSLKLFPLLNCSEIPNITAARNLEPSFIDLSDVSISRYGTSVIRGENSIQNIIGIILNPSMTIAGNLDFRNNKMNRQSLINLFNSMPTVDVERILNITGCTGAADLTASDMQIATDKGWTVTR